MAHPIAELVARTLAAGLKRRSMIDCARWAEKCRIIGPPFPGPFTFKWHPWTREMHNADCEEWVGQKAAQMGFTETVLDRAFYTIDIKKQDVLYVLPAKNPDASDFSSSRFDAALELSPYLTGLFSDVKNVGHKRAGSANLYIRGSRSKSGLKSIPVSLLVLDELEEMTQENIPLATERLSGQVSRQIIKISTPRIAGHGINVHFQNSTQEHFFFKCPSCSRLTELKYPDCLVITAESLTDPRISDTHLICKECKAILPHETKPDWLGGGIWVPSYMERAVRGFFISQLYSCTEKPAKIAEAFFRAQQDLSAEQELWNSKLGDVHEVKGARVSDEDFDSCLRNFLLDSGVATNTLVTMGVDQGKKIHYEICAWDIPGWVGGDINMCSTPRVISRGFVDQFEDLDFLMHNWRVNFCVIDAHPEKRKALEFASRWFGHVRLCFYVEGVRGKDLHESALEPTVNVDRTSWMDLALGRFKSNSILLPNDIGLEYRAHIKAPVRVYLKNRDDQVIGRYVTAENVPDHFAHARTYAEIALKFAALMTQSQTVKSPR